MKLFNVSLKYVVYPFNICLLPYRCPGGISSNWRKIKLEESWLKYKENTLSESQCIHMKDDKCLPMIFTLMWDYHCIMWVFQQIKYCSFITAIYKYKLENLRGMYLYIRILNIVHLLLFQTVLQRLYRVFQLKSHVLCTFSRWSIVI